MSENTLKIILLTVFALFSFAFNSILCRLALGQENVDAVGFTAVRLISGALMLSLISTFRQRKSNYIKRGNWVSAFFLFGYAIFFSLAYLKLTTATGALILFTTVQLTILCYALFKGERPQMLEWIGLLLAFSGLVYLVFPRLSAPPVFYSLLMLTAGICWGFYTIRGKGSEDPLAETAGNFLRTVPMILIVSLFFISSLQISPKGFAFAVLSGAAASGIGYSVWYAVLKSHTATRTAILQLSVPAIASTGGILFLNEDLSLRIILASAAILGGIFTAIIGKKQISASQTQQ